MSPTLSSRSDAVIGCDAVCDAVNALPLHARIMMVAALKERAPAYYWTVDHNQRLTCQADAETPRFYARGGQNLSTMTP